MKKNTMMRVASIMLVLVLMTSSVISGTFAKYTTQDRADDSARVAKWGVELQVVGNLYGETYSATAGDSIIANDTTTGFTVQSKDAANDVVAPGTKNDNGFTFSLNGKPEVSGQVSATITHQNIFLKAGTYGLMVVVPAETINAGNFHEFTNLYVKTIVEGVNTYAAVAANAEYSDTAVYCTFEDEVVVANDYYPVEYAMSGDVTNYNVGFTGTDLTVDTLKAIAEQIGTKFGAADDTTKTESECKTTVTYSGKGFTPNQDLAAAEVIALGNQRITWKWDFCQENSEHVGHAACDYCKADTILGNLMANEIENMNTMHACEVVKLSGEKYVAPVEFKDYCLNTEFAIDIIVTQVN